MITCSNKRQPMTHYEKKVFFHGEIDSSCLYKNLHVLRAQKPGGTPI